MHEEKFQCENPYSQMPRYRKDAGSEFVHQDIWILVTWERTHWMKEQKK